MIELVIAQRRRSLGGSFDVGRVLPFVKQRMVGPFVFFDHMGPLDLAPGVDRNVDVRPHPHIGLSTVTYLFAGEIMHRIERSAVMVLGGEPVGERFVFWNFASSSKDRLAQAAVDWKAGRMKVPDADDAEFIPLPDDPASVMS